MKMEYWALSLLACGGMLACTNDEVAENNGKEEGTEVSYLAVNVLTASGPGSRDLPEGYEEGLPAENAISKMRFYLFNSDGTPYTLIGGRNCVVPDDAYTEDTNDKENETVEEVGNAVLVIDGSTATPPASVVAILNYDPGTGGTDAFANKNLTQLKAVVGNYGATGSGNFIMSNSVYNDATTIGEVSIDGKLTNDAEEAKKNPVDIYVERVVAKVSVTFSGAEKTGNQYLVSGVDNAADAIYAKVMGWQVADYKNQSYILKNIDKTWTDENIGITPWFAANFHRSFWATSATGSVVNDKSWNDINGNTAAVYTQENTPSTALADVDNNDLTKVIVAVQLVDKAGVAKPRYQYLGLPYGSETAILTLVAAKFPSYYIKTGANAYRQITAAELKFVKGSAVEGASYRVYAQLADEFTAAMDGEKTNLYTKSSESSYQQVNEAGLTTLKADLKKYYAQVWKDGMAYYYTTIKHLGNSGKVGEYGVVRNHVYKVAITDIKGFGTPVYDPDEDIDPVKPADDASYLAAKINILSWRIVNSSVTLE